MNKTPIDRNLVGFDKQSMAMMMSSLVTSNFDVYQGLSNSVMLCEFKKFLGQCTEHETYMPFLEILDVCSQCQYTHLINGKSIRRESDSSGFSFYMSRIGYGVELKSDNYIDCNIIGINPVFFDKILGCYRFNGFLPSYLKDIQDPFTKKYMQDIVFDIKNNLDMQNYLPIDDIQLHIDEKVAFLLKLIVGKYLSNRCNFRSQQIKDIIEYFDNKATINEPIRLEELIEKFPVEVSLHWLDTFKNIFKKTPYQYYIDRKKDLLCKLVEDNQIMLISDQKKLFNLIHELVENPDSSLAIEFQMSGKNLLPFLSKKLGYDRYKNERTFKNHCDQIEISCLRYYHFLCIEKAKHLLITTNKDVRQISYICGFDNYESFKKSFRNRADNLPPEQFREKYKKTALYFDLNIRNSA